MASIMGQEFRLGAPRDGRRLFPKYAGKLGTILFDGTAQVLVDLLAVPIRPENTLPVLEPHLLEAHSQTEDGAANSATNSPLEDLSGETSAKRKADSVGATRNDKRAKLNSGQASSDTRQPITFSNLPEDVHWLIFDHLESIEDAVCLGLTSRYFWAIGRARLHNYYCSFVGRWAGMRIVCAGENVAAGDYPPALFSAEDVKVLSGLKMVDFYSAGFPEVPLTLYHLADRFKDILTYPVEEVNCLEVESRKVFNKSGYQGGQSRTEMEKVFSVAAEELLVDNQTYFPSDQTWILRNQTTEEFVRSEAIALRPEFIHGPKIDVIGFGEVVMSRICWSTSDSVSMKNTTYITRGVWAGHAFDITTLARHEDETKITEAWRGVWRDVSEDVAHEIADIWESQYGPGWRQLAIERRMPESS